VNMKVDIDLTGWALFIGALLVTQNGCLEWSRLKDRERDEYCLKYSSTPADYNRCQKRTSTPGILFDDFPEDW
jgi:hypothetical protein